MHVLLGHRQQWNEKGTGIITQNMHDHGAQSVFLLPEHAVTVKRDLWRAAADEQQHTTHARMVVVDT